MQPITTGCLQETIGGKNSSSLEQPGRMKRITTVRNNGNHPHRHGSITNITNIAPPPPAPPHHFLLHICIFIIIFIFIFINKNNILKLDRHHPHPMQGPFGHDLRLTEEFQDFRLRCDEVSYSSALASLFPFNWRSRGCWEVPQLAMEVYSSGCGGDSIAMIL